MTDHPRQKVLDQGYVQLVEAWGSDERVIESARMSTQKGFVGWSEPPYRECSGCGYRYLGDPDIATRCPNDGKFMTVVTPPAGDERLLKFLWDNAHQTPFEMCGFTIEVKAPIFVFREWHRHRVPFGYNEASARYSPLPYENYIPSIERLMLNAGGSNRQAGTVAGAASLTRENAESFRDSLARCYDNAQRLYENALAAGVPKELARVVLPVGRYSCMRATSNLRGWLSFLKLRCHQAAQFEIRQYANAVAGLVKDNFPRTHAVAQASVGMP